MYNMNQLGNWAPQQ